MGTRNPRLVGYSFIFSVKNWSSLSLIGAMKNFEFQISNFKFGLRLRVPVAAVNIAVNCLASFNRSSAFSFFKVPESINNSIQRQLSSASSKTTESLERNSGRERDLQAAR